MASIHDSIRAAVHRHYADADADKVLPLSELGTALRDEGAWPPTNDDRPLGKIVDDLHPGIKTLRDPQAKAYVAVFPADKEYLALEEIGRRHKLSQLQKLPRPLVLAFCLNKTGGADVYFKISPPFRYQIGEPSGPEYLLVDEQYRVPGLFVENLRSLSEGDALGLMDKIAAWAHHHRIKIEDLQADEVSRKALTQAPPSPGPNKGENALERLYAAQPQGLAERMVMPFDIAVYLSRLP